MGAAGKRRIDFGQYMKEIGLAERTEKLKGKDKKALAKEARLRAKKIMLADLGARGKLK